MTNQSSIQYITTLLDSPDTLTEGDQSSIALFRQTFPYFVPVRYLAALEVHKKTEFAPEMLSAIKPYLGNWILFCDFLDAGANARPLPMSKPATAEQDDTVIATEQEEEPIIKVVDKKKVEVKPADEPAPQSTNNNNNTNGNNNNRNRDRRDNNRRDNKNQRRDYKEPTPPLTTVPIPNTERLEFAESEEVSSSLLSTTVETEAVQETAMDNKPKLVSSFDADMAKLAAEEASDAKEWVMESTVQVLTPVLDVEAVAGTATSWLDRVNSDMDEPIDHAVTNDVAASAPVGSFLSSIQDSPDNTVTPIFDSRSSNDSSVLHEVTIPLPEMELPLPAEVESTPQVAEVFAAPPVEPVPVEMQIENAVEKSAPFVPEELPVPIAPYKVHIAPDELPAVIVADNIAPEPVAIIPQKVVYEPLPELLPYSAAAQTTPYNVIVSAHDPEPTPDDNKNAWQNVAFGPGILMMELDSRKPAEEPTAMETPVAAPEPIAEIQPDIAAVYTAPLAEIPEQEAAMIAAPENEVATEVKQSDIQATPAAEEEQRTGNKIAEEQLIYPIYTEDYFLHQGIPASPDIPDEIDELIQDDMTEEEKSLMVVMSFTEWLLHFKKTAQKQKEEKKDQKALKTMWQKEKLAAAMEEENEEIPENVFEMAVNSITKEDGLASESLADIYIKQGKYDKAIEMYRKLSLRNPKKNVYFARKIEEILKEKQS